MFIVKNNCSHFFMVNYVGNLFPQLNPCITLTINACFLTSDKMRPQDSFTPVAESEARFLREFNNSTILPTVFLSPILLPVSQFLQHSHSGRSRDERDLIWNWGLSLADPSSLVLHILFCIIKGLAVSMSQTPPWQSGYKQPKPKSCSVQIGLENGLFKES